MNACTSSVTIFSFMYTSFKTHRREPRRSVLEVSQSERGPWEHVLTIDGTAGTGFELREGFQATGRFWRWKIESCYGASAWIREVKFMQKAGGRALSLQTSSRMELTLTSAVIMKVLDITNSLSKKRSVEKTSNWLGQVGTHRLVNKTDLPLAFVPVPEFDNQSPDLQMLPSNESRQFSLKKTLRRSVRDVLDAPRDPIVDIKILNKTIGMKVPPGYTEIQKNLNKGGRGEIFNLCYRRSAVEPPITNIIVTYGGAGDHGRGLYEPVPNDYNRLDTDVSCGSGGRDVFISFSRSFGAPIVDLAVIFHNEDDFESVPSGFIQVPKDLNSQQSNNKNIMLCYRRKPYALSPGFEYPHSAVIPITEIDVIVIPRRSKESEIRERLRGDLRERPDIPWECVTLTADGNGRRTVEINAETGGADIFVLYRRNPDKLPITNLTVAFEGVRIPDWMRVDKNINEGAKCKPAFVHYRREPGAAPIMVCFWRVVVGVVGVVGCW